MFPVENAKPRTILSQMIAEACEARENQRTRPLGINQAKSIQTQQDEVHNRNETIIIQIYIF